jgi:putative FmdB family regulatory protein
MPIHDILCNDCGHRGETMTLSGGAPLTCPQCGSENVVKQLSATSTLTGKTQQAFPKAGDTACCGSSPGHAGCAGPGSCCGKAPIQ